MLAAAGVVALLAGAASVARGAGPLLASPSAVVEGGAAYTSFGGNVAGAGDVNGDGYDDVVVGASGFGAYGAVFVFLGGPGGIAGSDPSSAATVIQGTSVETDLFGAAVAGAGDTNGDGYDDIVVARSHGPRAAYVFLGGPAGIPSGDTSNAAAVLVDDDSYDAFGQYVAGAGDTNGDGYDDVVVGGETDDDEGAALVYLGGLGGIASGDPSSAGSVVKGDHSATGYGWVVAGAGDTNGDGYDDVVAGPALPENGNGTVYVFRGGPAGIPSGDETVASTVLYPDQPGSYFGGVLAGAGDTNGDGYDDVVVGAWHYDGGRGAAFVFLGGPNGIASGNARTASQILHSNRVQDRSFGYGLAGAGDVNGDGYDDVIVGAQLLTSPPGWTTFLYLGGAGLGVSRWADSIVDTGPPSSVAAAGVGDVDADGFDDVALGDFAYENAGPFEGRALFYLGKPDDWRLLDYDSTTRRARTAGIGEAYDYGVWQDYPTGFGSWTHVAGGARSLLLYNSSTGAAALGTVDVTGAFTTLRSWAPGTSFGAGWTHVVWHGDELFFYASGNGLAAVGRIEGPSYDFHQYNSFNLISGWTHVASVQGYLLFYKQSNGTGYACQLNPVYNTTTGALTQINFQYVRVQVFSAGWTHVVDARNGVLFYNATNGGYRIGDFDRTGYFTTRTAPWPAWSAYPLWAYTTQRAGWTQVVAAGGRVLFYNKNTGEGVTAYIRTAAQSASEQAEPLATVQTYSAGALSSPSTMRWSHVVPVAAQ